MSSAAVLDWLRRQTCCSPSTVADQFGAGVVAMPGVSVASGSTAVADKFVATVGRCQPSGLILREYS